MESDHKPLEEIHYKNLNKGSYTIAVHTVILSIVYCHSHTLPWHADATNGHISVLWPSAYRCSGTRCCYPLQQIGSWMHIHIPQSHTYQCTGVWAGTYNHWWLPDDISGVPFPGWRYKNSKDIMTIEGEGILPGEELLVPPYKKREIAWAYPQRNYGYHKVLALCTLVFILV